jgi:hypothetical protein
VDTSNKGAVIITISEGPSYGPMADCAESASLFTIRQKGERVDTQTNNPSEF